MKPVIVPTTDTNSETAILVAWHVADQSAVESGDLLAELETSKAVVEVRAGASGLILWHAQEGDDVRLDAPIAHLFDDESSLKAYQQRRDSEAADKPQKNYRATIKAEHLAAEHGIDLEELFQGDLITTKVVEAAIREARPVDYSQMPAPLSTSKDIERVLLIGGGLGATQVIDIFRDDRARQAVAALDDNRKLWGNEVYGVPIVGGPKRIQSMFEEGFFDSAIVTISTSIPARTKFRAVCEELQIPMTNAIDRTSKVAADATMGAGNVICAFCHFGTGAVVGDNNFFSAYNSFDHHSVLASDISTGPGCMTSALVKVGNRVRLGTGIFIEPYVELGDGVRVASGSVIVSSVPAEHAVKMKTGQTVVVPIRR